MIPDELAISVITLAELEFGVYSATDQQTSSEAHGDISQNNEVRNNRDYE